MIHLLLQSAVFASQFIELQSFLLEQARKSVLFLGACVKLGFELSDLVLDATGSILLVLDIPLEFVYGDVEGVDGSLVLEQLGLVGFEEGNLVLQPPTPLIEPGNLIGLGPDDIVEPLDLLRHDRKGVLVLLDLGLDVLILNERGLQLGVPNPEVVSLLHLTLQQPIQPLQFEVEVAGPPLGILVLLLDKS